MSNSSLATYTKLTENRTHPRRHAIDHIIIHCYVGQVTARQGCDNFAKTKAETSANYVVGYDGSIGLSVDEGDRAWTTGGSIKVNNIKGSTMDHRAVTIEVACEKVHPYAITDAAWRALVELCADICRRNGIKALLWEGKRSLVGQVEQQNMAVHRWFANKACPGEYIYSRLGILAEEVNAKLYEEGETVEVTLQVLKKGAKGPEVRTLQQLLTAKGYDPRGVDGSFGNGCDRAVKQFQEDKGLTADGCVGKATWTALLAGE